MNGVGRRSPAASQPTRRQRPAPTVNASTSPKDHAPFRPVPERRGSMSCHISRDGRAAQTTCRLRPSSTGTEVSTLALEITHAFRLRHKLCDGSDEKLVVNVWGVGYRLIDAVSTS